MNVKYVIFILSGINKFLEDDIDLVESKILSQTSFIKVNFKYIQAKNGNEMLEMKIT